jgi:hypothetical protein
MISIFIWVWSVLGAAENGGHRMPSDSKLKPVRDELHEILVGCG